MATRPNRAAIAEVATRPRLQPFSRRATTVDDPRASARRGRLQTMAAFDAVYRPGHDGGYEVRRRRGTPPGPPLRPCHHDQHGAGSRTAGRWWPRRPRRGEASAVRTLLGRRPAGSRSLRSARINTCPGGLRIQWTSQGEFLPPCVGWKYFTHTSRRSVLLSISVAVLVPKNFKRLGPASPPHRALHISGHFPGGASSRRHGVRTVRTLLYCPKGDMTWLLAP